MFLALIVLDSGKWSPLKKEPGAKATLLWAFLVGLKAHANPEMQREEAMATADPPPTAKDDNQKTGCHQWREARV
jgi:hypothetical protein